MKHYNYLIIITLSLILSGCFLDQKPQDINVSTSTDSDIVAIANKSLNEVQTGSITNSWGIIWDNSFFGELRAESQGFGSYKIVGALKGDFKNISVVWRYDGKEDEPYTLKKYTPEKRVFEYYIQPKFKTIQKGENTYIFTGEKSNGEKESKELTINEDHNIILSGKYCILDICIDESKPFTKDGDIITQKIEDVEKTTETNMNINEKSITVSESIPMSNLTIKVFKQNDFFVRYSSTQSCGPFSWKQEILDPSGKVIHNVESTLGIPRNFTIGTKTFTLEDLNNDTSTYIYGTLADNKVMTGSYSKSDANIGSIFLQDIKKNKNSFPKKYTLSFKEYPDIKLVYSMKDAQPERVVYLGTDSVYLKNNIDPKGNLLDVEVSNKILSYYNTDRRFVPTTDIQKSIETVTKENIPLFHVERLTNDGYYLLYPRDGYSFESFAEMCKPVVYVYKKNAIDIKVSLDLFGKGFFTKLIPGFSTGTTWDIRTQQNGLTVIDKGFYEYLYYSVKVKGYRFNKDGWIIQGNEAVWFFEDKLPKLNFRVQEQKDFIDFWKDQFKKDSYYFVSFKYNREMDKMVGLFFDKKPTSIERVLLEGYEISSIEGKERFLYKNIWNSFDSYLLRTFDRSPGFDVFEWGWVLKDNENTIIR